METTKEMRPISELLTPFDTMTVQDLMDMLSDCNPQDYVRVNGIMFPVAIKKNKGFITIKAKYASSLKDEQDYGIKEL